MSKSKINRKYGWQPDLADFRDLKMKVSHTPESIAALPSSVDMRSKCPPVWDQGSLGSCTGHAIAGAVEFDQMAQKPVWNFMPSRLFIYYNERVMEGTVSSDAGAQIRDGIQTVVNTGVCREDLWPYDISQFAAKPPAAAFTNALKHKATVYQRINQDVISLKTCLAGGRPFVFGFTVYESFESDQVAQTGVVPMPKPTEQVLGGHAVLAVGYDDSTQRFLVRNSWGTSWGMAGYFTIPYTYLTNNDLADDFWSITSMSN